MRHLIDTNRSSLEAWLTERRLPAYRARQVRRWIFEDRAGNFDDMSDLPKPLRTALAEDFTLWSTKTVHRHSVADGTEKLILETADGHRIECVLIREDERRTLCVSTQVGCAMGCVFCASGIGGVIRNLTTGEILEQMLLVERLLPKTERLNHIVVMGMGEPLANLDRLLPALAEASSPQGLGIGARKITISTVGLPGGIDRLAEQNIPYHLAVSLHAPDDMLRNELVPTSKRIKLSEILEAADRFYAATSRRVTFEYVLLAGINDKAEQAARLAKLLDGRPVLVNLIPYNPVDGLPYRTPTDDALGRFVGTLEKAGVQVQVRKRKGDKISAACGQLRRIRPEGDSPRETFALERS